jgi:GntR family transcriptional regulator
MDHNLLEEDADSPKVAERPAAHRVSAGDLAFHTRKQWRNAGVTAATRRGNEAPISFRSVEHCHENMQHHLDPHKAERRAERARHIRDLLRMEILGGRHGWGLLPTEAELTVRFATTRNAMRDALDLLRREGLIERSRGAGTFIVVAKAIHRHDRLQPLAASIEDGYRRVTVDMLTARIQSAGETVANKLQIEPGSDVVFLERRLILDGSPISLWSSYLPADLASGLLGADLSLDFYDVVEGSLGVELKLAEFLLEARLADELIAELLHVAQGSPILFMERTLYQTDGRALEFGFVSLRGDRIQFVSVLHRKEAGL